MEKYNRDIFLSYKPSQTTFELALKVTEKLGKLNTTMRGIFDHYKLPSRIFAFIESKFSSKIEGIYTTLYDVVNTGQVSKQEEIISPLIHSLLKEEKIINSEKINSLSDLLNIDKNKEARFAPEFGIWNHKKNIKVYQPLLDKELVNEELKLFWTMINKSETNVINAIFFHIFFEKIHPFIDANGRIGRLILNRKISKITNFCNLLPISWALFINRDKYYAAFNFKENTLDEAIQKILEIILYMYEHVKGFLIDLKKYYQKYKDVVIASSTRMTEELSKSILFSLQTKQSFLIKRYSLNPRTINNIFENIKKEMDFNVKTLGRKKLYWNIELEIIIERWFGE